MWPHFVLMTPSAGLPLLLALLKLQIEIREASFQNSTESSFSNVNASLNACLNKLKSFQPLSETQVLNNSNEIRARSLSGIFF